MRRFAPIIVSYHRSELLHFNIDLAVDARVVECRQTQHEDLATFYKRWDTNLEVLESKWGKFMPVKLKPGADKEDERTKFHVCLFLKCVNWHDYGKVVDELNNDFLNGNEDVYPKTVADTVNILSHRMDIDGAMKKKKDKNKAQDNDGMLGTEASFLSVDDKVCYCCGAKDHLSPDCSKRNTTPQGEWYIRKALNAMQFMQDDTSESDHSSPYERPSTPYRRRRSGTAWHGHPSLSG